MSKDIDKCAQLRAGLHDIIKAWEAIPGDRTHTRGVIQRWLVDDMKPSIDKLRLLLGEEQPSEQWAFERFRRAYLVALSRVSKRDEPYLVMKDRSYTREEISHEIEDMSPLGTEILVSVMNLSADLLLRQKYHLSDSRPEFKIRDDLPADIKEMMFQAHTHAELKEPHEIVYTEESVIGIINHIFTLR